MADGTGVPSFVPQTDGGAAGKMFTPTTSLGALKGGPKYNQVISILDVGAGIGQLATA